MPVAITPVVQFTTTNPTRPIPGEKIGMETGPAPLAPLLQTLVDRDNYAWAQVSTLMPYCGEIEITAANLVVPPVAISVLTGGVWKVFSTVGASIPLTPLAAVADEWRYAYLFDNGGVLDVQFSADAPDATRTWKSTGISTHRYLCPIRMSSVAGAAVPMVGRYGHWVYRSPLTVKQWTANEVLTATSVAEAVPPGVRRADASVRVVSPDAATPVYTRVYSANATDPPSIESRAIAAANVTSGAEVDVGGTRVVNTVIENIVGAPTVNLRINGFRE